MHIMREHRSNKPSPWLTASWSQERAYLGRYVDSEILNHSKLRHPHVVGFHQVFLSPNHINM